MNSSQSIFKVPTAVDVWQEQPEYHHFHGAFMVGMQADTGQAHIRQRRKASTTVSPPDHFYEFDLAFRDAGKCDWLSFVHDMDLPDTSGRYQITTLISLKCTVEGKFPVKVRVNSSDKSKRDIPLGVITVQEQDIYVQETLSTRCELTDRDIEARIILGIPAREEVCVSLSMFNVFLTK